MVREGSTRVPPEFRLLVEPCHKPPCRGTLHQTSQNLVEFGGTPQTAPDHRCPCRTWWNPGRTLLEPCLKPPRITPQPSQNLGTLVELLWNLTSNHPRPSRSPCRTWWNPVWNPRLVEPYIKPPRTTSQNLVEPCKPPGTTPQPLQNLVERWWNFRGTLHNLTSNHPRLSQDPCVEPSSRGTLHQTTTSQNLVEPRITPLPSQNLVEPWWNRGGTLVQPWWNPGGTLPQTTPDHPAALAEPGRTLVEPWWNPVEPGGTLVEPSLVEP